jgi:hypothetical protein
MMTGLLAAVTGAVFTSLACVVLVTAVVLDRLGRRSGF